MDFRKRLSKSGAIDELTKMGDGLASNTAAFKALVDIYIEGPYKLTHRAAHVLNVMHARDPSLMGKYLKKIIGHLSTPGVHDAYRRNTIRMLQWIDIPRSLQGWVLDICFSYLQDKKEAIAIKVFSMSVIDKIGQGKPSLLNELRIVVEDQLPYAGPAFRSRARRILKSG
jgi:hypothetical protein